jgi:hypothetical protein
MKLEFSQQIFQKQKISWKDAKWELSHCKRADMMQVIVAFHNFMNAPNYWVNFHEIC